MTWEPHSNGFNLTKQYDQMTVCCSCTDQSNESIPAPTSHKPFWTPFEVTQGPQHWSQNTFNSVRKNIIWSWNPFSKDVLQNVDLTFFFIPFPPHISLSHWSQSSARKPSNPDREEESVEEEKKITWAQTLSQISCCKMLCHYYLPPSPTLVFQSDDTIQFQNMQIRLILGSIAALLTLRIIKLWLLQLAFV